MARPVQIFVAPGDEQRPLLDETSPWVSDRWVEIPSEQWSLLLAYAKAKNDSLGEELALASGGADPMDTIVSYEPDRLTDLTDFVRALATSIESEPLLVEEPTDEIPDVFEPEEHARMLRGVAAVLEESRILGQAYRAWSE